jgi:hypothetical protein
MTPAKSYRDRLDTRPGFPIRRGSVDEVLPHVKPLGELKQ